MKYVWYASYGSNLLEERFLCYIRGGQPAGSTESEPGARDPSLPLRSIQFSMPYPLYFAKERTKWGKGGVALFVKSEMSKLTHYRKPISLPLINSLMLFDRKID